MTRYWIAGAAAALLFVGCWGGGGNAGQLTPAPEEGSATATTAIAVATTEPSASDYFQAVQLRPVPAVPLPAGVVVYSRDAVWEGAGGSLRRWYTDGDGELQIDELLRTTSIQGVPRALLNATRLGGDAWWAALCHGSCYGGPDPVTLTTSDDGGVTWHEVITLVEGGSLGGAAHGLAFVWDASNDWALSTVTEGQTPSPITLAPGVNGRDVRVFERGGSLLLVIIDQDRKTVRDAATGTIVAAAPIPNPFQFVTIQGFTPGTDGHRLSVQWIGPGDPSSAEQYLGFVDIDSGKLASVYSWKPGDGLGGVFVSGWIADGVAIGRADFDAATYLPGQVSWLRGLPAIIDFNDGVVAPILDFVEQIGQKAGGPVPLEVETGTFARVVTGGSCLNVRPSPDQAPFDCYPDGVLLRLLDDSQAEPAFWHHVQTPDGTEAWAAAEFLELATAQL